ncbi:cupin domain-containing protein [Marinobacter sp. M216]|uniref:Cupin domain-containing protein n=1 Tax=Marinobacter albus TaxID=3030833 RepID=A0ABT7HA28_9GAMM|nr:MULTISPECIES: cupin domain-containing protein [unclassified Marinobacter]MBW7470843.1 cupin domain-containing protein [Marinobacter sp. F4218]MDK9556887.1 cupin domain-containing protein [Marinobacter sp. M216]
MNRHSIIVKPGDYDRALSVVGTNITVLATKQDTKGQEFTYQSGESGMGPPPHSHEWDEAFFVIKGSVDFTCDGKQETCLPGTLVFVPGGSVHSFQYGPEGGEMLEVTGAGSLATQMFTAVDREVSPGPPDIENITEVLARNGVSLHL